MGGTPFKSGGCISCRKRKVKCDEQKPQCATCLKRGHVCPGYEEHSMFIHHKYRMFIQPQQSTGNYSPPYASDGDSESQDEIQDARFKHWQLLNQSEHFHRPAARMQVFAIYYDLYFPKHDRVSQVDYWQFLIYGFASLPRKSIMMEKAVSAISSIYIGKSKNDAQLFNYGLQMYTEAIRLLRDRIQRGVFDNEIIYTAVMFQEIEKIHRPRHLQAYFAHVEGTNKILGYCRPMIEETPLTDAIYANHSRMSRYLAATGAPTNQEEEINIAPAPERTLYERFVEIYDDSKPIDAAIDAAIQSNQDRSVFESLLSQCLALERRWLQWFQVSRIGDARSHAAPGQILTPSLPMTDPLFGRAYLFTSLDVAIYHIWHSSMMIITLKLIHKVRARLVSSPSQMEMQMQMQTRRQVGESAQLYLELDHYDYHYRRLEMYADRACLCIPFCAQDDMGAFGLHAVLLPMSTIVEAFVDLGQREKFFWCQRFYQIGVDRCNNTATHMSEVGWALFRERGLYYDSDGREELVDEDEDARVVHIAEGLKFQS